MPWSEADLTRIGDSRSFHIAAVTRDGTFSKRTFIWVVRAGDDLYVRPYYGGKSRWFQAAKADPRGQVDADGVRTDVTFEVVGDVDREAIDAAYQTKYDSGADAQYVPPMIADRARQAAQSVDSVATQAEDLRQLVSRFIY